jgi:WD40 repeat protein
LWLLDISSGEFERVLVGRSRVFGNIDTQGQDVTPSWSPDEGRFVFGGSNFVVEVYDLIKSKRNILVGPDFYVYNAKWSPSGKWIAAMHWTNYYDSLYIFSADGSLYSAVEVCDHIEDFQWVPEEDKISFVCSGNCNGLCDPRSSSLWLWDLEDIDI